MKAYRGILFALCFAVIQIYAAPEIALNVDGMAYYYPNSCWANIVHHFGWQASINSYISFLPGYISGDYQATWSGPNPNIWGDGNSYLQITGTGTGIFHLHHTTSNDNGGSYYVQLNGCTNFVVLAPDAVPGTPFRKPFLDKLAPWRGSVIRFMDWMQTVGSPVVNWSDRCLPSDPFRTGANGVAYEEIIALCNYLNVTPWINVPAMATDDYVHQLAQLYRNNLNPNLSVRIEYSNELWNCGDQLQGTWNMLQARSDPQFTHTDDLGRSAQRAAERERQIIEIFKSEFGGNSRIIPTMGGFIVGNYYNSCEFDWLKSKGVNLTGDNWHIAIAPYCPGSPTDLGEVDGDDATAIFSKLYNFMNNSIKPWVQAAYSYCASNGVILDSYEAAVGGSLTGTMNLSTHLAMQYDPRIGQLQKDFITMWDRASGGGYYNVFGIASTYTQWGCWGLLEDLNATGSVKYDAVVSMMGAVAPPPTVIAPSITQQPASLTVNAGGSATFSVTASGSSPLSYQWSYNGSAISGANGSSFAITSAQQANAGNYLVTVSNSAGVVMSNSATLTVNVPTPPPTSGKSLTLLTPNGGEKWAVGSIYKITWTSTGSIANVMLYFSVDGAVNWQQIGWGFPR